jgi:hypothetical protein
MTAPALRCAGGGVAGSEPRIRYSQPEPDEPPTIRPYFGLHQDGRPALLCDPCAKRWRKPKRRRKAAAPGGLL